MRTTTRLLALPVLIAGQVQACDEAALAEARKVAKSVPPELSAVLSQVISSHGHAVAIAARQDQAPAMVQTASEKTGRSCRRMGVRLHHRDPRAAPVSREQLALQDLDRRRAISRHRLQ